MRAVYIQLGERTSHALAVMATLCLSLTLGGCIMGGPLPRLVSDEDVTGSIPAPASAPVLSPLPQLSSEDWTFASKALATALDPQGSGAAVLWESPTSGARGSMTPVGFVYAAEGQTCRAFLADIAGAGPALRLQGRGCREGQGGWVVSDLKPFGA